MESNTPSDDSDREDLIRERGTCAFCDMLSDYVLTVTDPAPESEKVIDEPVAMPICMDHHDMLKQSDLNARRSARMEDNHE